MSEQNIVTRQGLAQPDGVSVRGRDLCADLIGHLDLGQMLFLLVKGREPNPSETRMINALLVGLTEDGITGSVLSARLTLKGAPEALQGAVAAGILGAGSAFLGTSELAAKMLQETIGNAPSDTPVAVLAQAVVVDYQARRAIIPGVGHRRHKGGDPRAHRLLAVAKENGLYGRYAALMEAIAAQATETVGRPLPLNITGAIAAISSELGFPWRVAKAFAILGRTAGIIGHLAEEIEHPMAGQVTDLVTAHTEYRPDA